MMAFGDCGSGWSEHLGLNKPWWMFFVNLRPACQEHDRAYRRGGRPEDRLAADRRLHDDIISICKKSWLWRFPTFRARANLTADAYYFCVRRWGEDKFTVKNGFK